MAGNSLKGHLSAALAYGIFGLNIVFCKDIANSAVVSPIALFTLRAAGAAAIFWLISLLLPSEKVDKGDFWKIAVASAVGLFVPQFTFLKAVTVSTPVDVAVISTLAPVFTMFIAAIALKEPISFKKACGVAISFAGVLILIFNSVHSNSGAETTTVGGYLLLLLNCISFASYLGIFKPLIQKYSVVTFMKWMFLASLLISFPLSAGDLFRTDFAAIPTNVALEIGFLIIFATFIAYFLIPLAQKNIRPTLVSMYSYLQPMIASVVAIIAGMDVVTWQKVVATLLVFGGVAIVNRSRARSV